MPNHVMTRIDIKGLPDDIESMLGQARTPDSDFDFQAFMPVPPEFANLKNISAGLALSHYLRAVSPANAKINIPGYPKLPMQDYEKIMSALRNPLSQQLQGKTIENGDPSIAIDASLLYQGKVAADCLLRYGSFDIHNWRAKNWGTGRNAYDVEIAYNNGEKEARIDFCTAWSPPIQILIAFGKAWPSLEINCKYADEDIGTQCGILSISSGAVVSDERFDDRSKDAFETCFEVWNLSAESEGLIYDPLRGNYIFLGRECNALALGAVPLSNACGIISKNLIFSRSLDFKNPEKNMHMKEWLMARYMIFAEAQPE